MKCWRRKWQSPSSRRPKQKGLPPSPRSIPNTTESFLRYQETLPLEPVTQDMLNSQMHLLRTPRRMDTLSHRQFRTNETESSHQLHPEIDRKPLFQGPRPKDVRLDKWTLKFDGSGRGTTIRWHRRLMERKQRQHWTFSDYVSDIHSLHFKLKKEKKKKHGTKNDGRMQIPFARSFHAVRIDHFETVTYALHMERFT